MHVENHEVGSHIQHLRHCLVAAADKGDCEYKFTWHKPIVRCDILSVTVAAEEAPKLLGEQATDCKVSKTIHARLNVLYCTPLLECMQAWDSSFRIANDGCLFDYNLCIVIDFKIL